MSAETCTVTVLEERPCGDSMPCQFHDKPRSQLVLSAIQVAEMQAVAWEKGRASGLSFAEAHLNPFRPVTSAAPVESEAALLTAWRARVERQSVPGYQQRNSPEPPAQDGA